MNHNVGFLLTSKGVRAAGNAADGESLDLIGYHEILLTGIRATA